MHIIVLANANQKNVLLKKKANSNVTLEFTDNYSNILHNTDADASFILNDEINIADIEFTRPIPIFINAVISTLQKFPPNVHRINAWPTFLERETWEIATKDEARINNIFQKLGWAYIIVPDEPGLIAARVVAMIVNEAYFAYGDGVSSKTEIDLAMRLGTNYPYGPFEWSKKIGLHNIYNLLKNLGEKDERYIIAELLKKEVLTYNNI